MSREGRWLRTRQAATEVILLVLLEGARPVQVAPVELGEGGRMFVPGSILD